MTLIQTLPSRLRVARQRKKLTIRAAIAASGVECSTGTLSKWESRPQASYDLTVLYALCQVYDISLDSLLKTSIPRKRKE